MVLHQFAANNSTTLVRLGLKHTSSHSNQAKQSPATGQKTLPHMVVHPLPLLKEPKILGKATPGPLSFSHNTHNLARQIPLG